jgi:hypothetical protein
VKNEVHAENGLSSEYHLNQQFIERENKMTKFVKVKKSLFICVFVLLLSPCVANASDYLGTFCINLQAGGESFQAFRVAVSSIDGANFLLNGTHTNPSTSGVGSVIGNASISGNSLIMTIRESHIDEFGISISTYHMNLNISTLSGTFQGIAQDYSNGFEPLSHMEGNASLVPCQ